MPDNSSTQTDPTQQSQQYPQSMFDQVFSEQIAQSGIDPTGREAWQAYFDLAEQTLRTARRVSELQVLSLLQAQLTRQVTASVIHQIQQNPQLLKPVVQQAMSSR